jgi:hypothetical protein
MDSSPIEAAPDESVPPAEPVAASRGWAVIVGALAVAAVWIVASNGPFGRLQTPVVPAAGQTGPTVIMGSFYPDQVGASVLPPEGASPSAPERGKLVAGKEDIYVYADGRMIWGREGLPVWLEQHLTPEGVELVRSGAVRLDGQSLDPGSPLPEKRVGASPDQGVRPVTVRRLPRVLALEHGVARTVVHPGPSARPGPGVAPRQ